MTNISTLESEPVSQSRAFFSETEPVVIETINNAVAFQEQEEDDEEVSDIFFFKFGENYCQFDTKDYLLEVF